MSDLPALRVIRADNPSPMTLDGTRTFVVGRARPVVIDPGPADDAHRDAVLAALDGAAPGAILLTHAHADHAAGAAELARRTGAPVCMAPGAASGAHAAPPVDRWLADGECVRTDAGEVRVVLTPGHAPEHAAFHWVDEAAVFVGDLLMGEGDTTLVAPPEGDLTAYLHSLQRLARLDARVLFPAHGEPLRGPAAAIRRYQAHRAGRIEQVRVAMEARPGASASTLVDAIYGTELHPALRVAAEGSIQAMLQYLQREADDR